MPCEYLRQSNPLPCFLLRTPTQLPTLPQAGTCLWAQGSRIWLWASSCWRALCWCSVPAWSSSLSCSTLCCRAALHRL